MASVNPTLSFTIMVYLLTIKLSSSNYLLWRSQVLQLLQCQNLLGYIEGSLAEPFATIVFGDSVSTNPKLAEWKQIDQLVLSLLLSTLTEEAMSSVVGLPTSRAVWSRLENTFSHRSKSRELRLKDDLQTMKKNDKSVLEFSRDIKAICDQLAAMGRLVDDLHKLH
ncbi:hypothetical protein F2P56_009531, partial [Juglans regia]